MSNCKGKLIIIITAFIFFIICNDISFAEYSINFKNISNKDGLSQSTIQTIYQDSKGYIWMGSNDGLNRYDGYKIKIYTSEDAKGNISDNYILNIIEDNKKNLWISTLNGLTKINIETWNTTTYFKDKQKGNLSNNFVNTVLITKTGEVLVGTADGVNLYDEKKDSFNRILDSDDILTSQNIKSIVQDVYGNIWIGTKSGINKINTINNEITKYHNWQEIDTLLADKYGYIWASTPGEGVIKINIENEESKYYKYDENDENSIPCNYVKKIHQDRQGTVWVATESGVGRYTHREDSFYVYNHKPYDQNSLVNNSTFSIIEDATGLIWVGTYSGVSIFDPNNQVEHYKHDSSHKNSLSSNVIHGIYEDEDGLLWVGTNDKGLNIIDRKNDTVKRIEEGNGKNDISHNKIKVITGKGNKVWVGTKEGLNEINREDMSVKLYTSKDNIEGDDIKSLFLDSKDFLWIGTPDGLSILNTKDDTIINLTYIFEMLSVNDTYVQDIYEDSYGNYWIGTFLGGGLIHINSSTKEMKVFNNKEMQLDNSGKMMPIRSINGDRNNNIWIGTSNGLIKHDMKSQEFRLYTKKDGLSNNTVYGILIDDQNNVWMSTNDGISVLDSNKETFMNLNINDGLQSNEFNGKAYHKSKNGEMFFGGINGLNILDPNKIFKEKYTPKIVFDNYEVEGKSYSDIDDLTFNYDENMIRIRFFVPNYRNDDDITFEYRLIGQNNEWITLNSNEAIFSKLDPGKYFFDIRYSDKLGNVSEISSVKFVINPPFWKSNLAIIIYSVLIVIFVYIVRNRLHTLDTLVSIRTKQLSKEMEKSNKLLNQVIKLERNKNNYFVNLSHELRTPLNVINSIEQLVTEFNKSDAGLDRDKLDYYMGIMKKNTKRLLNLINNIIDTNKIEHGSYKINMDYHDIVYIVEETTLGMKDYIESKGIELVIDTDVEEKMILCGSDEIERCIVNLVSNAAKFTPSGGTIEVTIKDLGRKIKISVRDTGVGIDEKFHKFIFDRFNQVVDYSTESKGGSGLGLTITKHIIDLHEGNIYVQSSKNSGSKFTIILPVDRD